jgi:hypothetical protein
MHPLSMNPAACRTADGARNASLGGARSEDTTGRKACKHTLTVQLFDGRVLTVRGREAQTLALLIQQGARGFTSGEASPLGWARRTSAYIFKLRKAGLDIYTGTQKLPCGTNVGVYILRTVVTVIARHGW